MLNIYMCIYNHVFCPMFKYDFNSFENNSHGCEGWNLDLFFIEYMTMTPIFPSKLVEISIFKLEKRWYLKIFKIYHLNFNW